MEAKTKLSLIVCVFALLGISLFGGKVALGVTFSSDTTIDSGDMSYEGEDVIVTACTLTVNGYHEFNSLQVINGGIVTHSANGATMDCTINLLIAGDVTVDVDSRIDVSGRGYSSSNGPGAGIDWWYASGGGHGGFGGRSSNWVLGGDSYGSITQPDELGSGGGYDSDDGRVGGSGGGFVKLVLGGTLTVNGSIKAHGNNGSGNQAGGGSGGSLWMITGGIAGNGLISANGGNGSHSSYAGGGAGGRIAVHYDSESTYSFGGDITTYGGSGYYYGGSGTVYLKPADETDGTLEIKADNITNNRENTLLDAQAPTGHLLIHSAAKVEVLEPITLASLDIADSSTYLFPPYQQNLEMEIIGDLTIRVNAFITANGRGYASSEGPGAGQDRYHAAGGGYGANAGRAGSGALGGEAYGSITEPNDLGSGGGYDEDAYRLGGRGGGAVYIAIGGVLTVNGSLVANGNNGSGNEAGGGSGGSLWLLAKEILGNGTISTNGGSGSNTNVAGGGSGGRIAIYYQDYLDILNLTLSAYGGEGYQRGGAGTLYTKKDSDTYGTVYVDSGGNSGNITPLYQAFWPELTIYKLKISDLAQVCVDEEVTFASLTVESSAVLTHSAEAEGCDITVLTNANIKTGTSFTANGKGFGSSEGPGQGADSIYASGAGYGGWGGKCSLGLFGGSSYGSITEPTDLGSGGGYDNYNSRSGGIGGGLVRMTVSGMLTVNGTISANGNNGANYSGGGSGGSVWLTVGFLNGNGTISANGGASGNISVSGGGGGGRIAIYYDDIELFDGILTTYGGTGHGGGGAGTVYTKGSAEQYSSLIIAANRSNRERTTLNVQTPKSNLRIESAAWVETTEPFTLASLVLKDVDTYMTPQKMTPMNIEVSGNLNIFTGAGISANNMGYDSSEGPGAGEDYFYGGGGGYGGRGGDSTKGASGGDTYGSFTEPVDFGSGGGIDTYHNRAGGIGAGAVYLKVLGTLTVNGYLTANGQAGSSYSGGGSGGSIWLTVGTLNGNGVISANGGNGGNISVAGGGGGGRIAIYWRDAYSDFAQLEVNGGERLGQIGTIFLYHGLLVGDYDLDDAVDVNDFAMFVAHWLESDCKQPDWCGNADLNRDRIVNFEDFAIFAQYWHKGL